MSQTADFVVAPYTPLLLRRKSPGWRLSSMVFAASRWSGTCSSTDPSGLGKVAILVKASTCVIRLPGKWVMLTLNLEVARLHLCSLELWDAQYLGNTKELWSDQISTWLPKIHPSYFYRPKTIAKASLCTVAQCNWHLHQYTKWMVWRHLGLSLQEGT